MIQTQNKSARRFRASNVRARFRLLNHFQPADEAPKPRFEIKAHDSITCPECQRNQSVFIDTETQKSTTLLSWLFDFYACTDCENKFTQAGLPIIVPSAMLVGALVIGFAQLVRVLGLI